MSSWGNSAAASNSVSFGAQVVFAGAGAANKTSNNTALYGNVTSDSFIPSQVVGQWPVTVTEMANTSSERKNVTAAGWVLRNAYEGPIVSVTATVGANVANGESVTVSNGSVNATLSLVTNATANISSATVVQGGLFVNTGVQVFTFNRERHVSTLTATGGSITGYGNTDVITMANGLINGVASVLTNSTGGFVTANLTISNPGLFSNAAANNTVVVTILAANGAASNGTGATITANLISSTGGTVSAPVLGGRAGRVFYETLVAMGSMSGSGTSVPSSS